MFNSLLKDVGIDPGDVRLLRHQDQRGGKDKTPYLLWTADPLELERYQAMHRVRGRAKFASPYWASFVVTPTNETLFVGLFTATNPQTLNDATPFPQRNTITEPGEYDLYETKLTEHLHEFIGRLCIDWGKGLRSWVQRAELQDKAITVLRREFNETDFPD